MPLSAMGADRNIGARDRLAARPDGSLTGPVGNRMIARMAPSKTVVHYKDGRILKGFTREFLPHREVFELSATESPEAEVVEVWTPDLKAVFFVKDLAGNPRRVDSTEFAPGQPVAGRKVSVRFHDGERLVGTTETYDPARKGFFLVPADAGSNIERCYVVVAATQEITFP
jgi:hypothetical protein